MSAKKPHSNSGQNLKIAFYLNLAFTIFEMIGGYYVNSVAIMSDALHDFGDSLSLGLGWYLDKKSHQKPDSKYSFGYARFSLLGALINSLIMLVGSIIIIYEAIQRIISPEPANAAGMIVFALVGIAVNGYTAWKLSSGKTLNERVVSWHLVEDVLGWTAILIASIVLYFKRIDYLDPALSILITLYILWGVYKRLMETLELFLQGVPRGIDIAKIEQDILKINHVKSIHQTHVWSLEGEHHVFTTHVRIANTNQMTDAFAVKQSIKDLLKTHGFTHYTIETELDEEPCDFDKL